MNKVVFVLLGKTGSGKSTVLNVIQDIRGNDKLEKLKSYTSRPRRSNEKTSGEYEFVSNEEFDDMVNQCCLMEHRKYVQAQGEIWQYGTGYPIGNYSITTMTPDVVDTVRSIPGINVYPIYIQVDDNLRYRRMLLRERGLEHPNYDEMNRRYDSDEKMYTEKVFRDAGVNETNTFNNNGFPFNTANEIIKYINYIIKVYEEKRRQEDANQ